MSVRGDFDSRRVTFHEPITQIQEKKEKTHSLRGCKASMEVEEGALASSTVLSVISPSAGKAEALEEDLSSSHQITDQTDKSETGNLEMPSQVTPEIMTQSVKNKETEKKAAKAEKKAAKLETKVFKKVEKRIEKEDAKLNSQLKKIAKKNGLVLPPDYKNKPMDYRQSLLKSFKGIDIDYSFEAELKAAKTNPQAVPNQEVMKKTIGYLGL